MANDSVCDQMLDFERLRVSALTKAAEISPLVKEVTIGPNSPTNNHNKYKDNFNTKLPNAKESTVEQVVKDTVSREEQHYVAMVNEYEKQWHNNADTIFKNLLEKMVTKRAEIMKQYWNKQTEDFERKSRELRVKKIRILQEWNDNDNLTVLEEAKNDERNNQYVNKRTIENMNRILDEQNKAASRFALITDSQTKICACYNDISKVLHNEEAAKDVYEAYAQPLNSVIINITNVMELCKGGVITDKEVKQAEVLALNIQNIKNKLFEQVSLIKQEQLRQRQEDEKQQQLQKEQEKSIQTVETPVEEPKRQLPNKPQAEETKKTKPLFYSFNNRNYYDNLQKYLSNYENLYQELLLNNAMKKYRFDCQKAVNTPVNAISSVSGTHMRDKFDKLSKLLKGDRIQVMDSIVSATQHPQGTAYCTALLAKKIVRQGDLLVSSNPEAAFPLASVAVALWAQFPEMGKLLEANFQRECPYLVPMFLPQKEGQSDKEFYLSRGYCYNDEGVVEKQDKFLKRMSGVFRLCCAIWIAKPPKFVSAPNPHGLRHAWKWLASFVNLKPEPDISATLLHDFFVVCGSECYKSYGKQFIKIIKLISTDYLAILEDIDEGGPKTRLKVFLQSVIENGNIPPPSGTLPSNVW